MPLSVPRISAVEEKYISFSAFGQRLPSLSTTFTSTKVVGDVGDVGDCKSPGTEVEPFLTADCKSAGTPNGLAYPLTPNGLCVRVFNRLV